MPLFLPHNWTGGLALLAMVVFLSILLDNIAAAILGEVIAGHVYNAKVGVGFLAGIVAASNAGRLRERLRASLCFGRAFTALRAVNIACSF